MSDPQAPRRDAVESLLAGCAPALRALGVRRVALFGSSARDEARPDSDLDLLVDFLPDQATYRNLLAVHDLLAARLGRRVDLVTPEGLSPLTAAKILAEARFHETAA